MSLFFDGRGEFGEKWSAKQFEKGRMKMKKHCDTAGKYGIKKEQNPQSLVAWGLRNEIRRFEFILSLRFAVDIYCIRAVRA